MGNGKIVYGGIHEVVNGKAIFMRQSLQNGQVHGAIAERLKEKGFRKRLDGYRVKDGELDGNSAARYAYGEVGDRDAAVYGDMVADRDGVARYRVGETDGDAAYMLTEEGLEYLFDELFSKKILRCLKETDDPACRMYALPMSMKGEEKAVDITGFVVYGIICNEWCRRMLWAEIPEGDDYYGYYEQSQYCSWALEECLKAEEIWDARLLIGLLGKMRQEEENSLEYRLLMKIIYAGYEELRKWMAGKAAVTGSEIKEQVFTAHSEEYSMLYCISEIVLAMVIAQDSGVEICFDYEMLLLLHFMERGEAEMRDGARPRQYGGKIGKVTEEEQRKFLKKFKEEYGTDSSLEALLFRGGTNRMDNLLLGVMAQYHISPRMFCGMELTEGEVRALLELSDKWTVKSYWSMLVIAHLCKYIGELKENYPSYFLRGTSK